MARQRKRQPIQVVLLPPVQQQPGVAPTSPEHLKAQERLNQLVGILVEAALVRFSELQQTSDGEKLYNIRVP